MEREPVRVLCVDDNPSAAEAVALSLQAAGGFHWLGMLPTADEVVERSAHLQPHVIVMDIDMPGKNPFSTIRELSMVLPEIRVVMLSGHIRREFIDAAFESGAWGYLSKSNGSQTIPESIRRVASGEIVLSPEVRAALEN